MEPSASAEMDGGKAKERKKIQFADVDEDGDGKDRKKIHFAVPSSAPTQLDPRQVEMIRRRRPTPATLFRVADQSSPEDDQSTHQWVVGENGVLKPKRVNPNVYQPPSLRDQQATTTADLSEKASGVTDSAKALQEDEEEEDEEMKKEKTEENRRGSD